MGVKICFMAHSLSHYLYNGLQIQSEELVQINSNSYADELQKQYECLIFCKNIEYIIILATVSLICYGDDSDILREHIELHVMSANEINCF